MHETLVSDDIRDELADLEAQLKTHIETGRNIDQQKVFLRHHVPAEIWQRSEVLLETLLNYLMEREIEEIGKVGIGLQNAFFDANLRNRAYEFAVERRNDLCLDPVQYTTDPRLLRGTIAGIAGLIAGYMVTSTLVSSTRWINVSLSGLGALVLAGIGFRVVYNVSTYRSRQVVVSDIERYLQVSSMRIEEWLDGVSKKFAADVSAFYSANGLKSEA